jgi:hypothetical protein
MEEEDTEDKTAKDRTIGAKSGAPADSTTGNATKRVKVEGTAAAAPTAAATATGPATGKAPAKQQPSKKPAAGSGGPAEASSSALKVELSEDSVRNYLASMGGKASVGNLREVCKLHVKQ